MNGSLIELLLSNNVFVELGLQHHLGGHDGADTFPPMPRLRTLTLEECRIQSVHQEAFKNLQGLRTLRLDGNLVSLKPLVVFFGSRLVFFNFSMIYWQN